MKNFKQNEYSPVYFERAFDLMLDMVYGEGGEGSGTIFCRYTNFKDVAEKFAEFVESRGYIMSKSSVDMTVTFSDNQTHVTISGCEPHIHPLDDFIFIM